MNQIFSRTLACQNKIIGLGFTYKPRKTNVEIPKEPLVFEKPLSTLCLNPKLLKLQHSAEFPIFHEVELGILIGKKGSRISRENAFNHIGGYFLVLDLTNRMLFQLRKEGKGLVLCKGGDNYTPCSSLVLKENIKDINNLDLELRVDGQIKQYANTSELAFNISHQIEYISQYMTLNEGDLILSGTPEGITDLQDGQHLQATLKENHRTLAELDMKLAIDIIQ